MSAQEVHDAIVATLKPGEYVPAEVSLGGTYPVLRYVSRDDYKTRADPDLAPHHYWELGARIVRLLDTRTDDAEWVEVTHEEYLNAYNHADEPRVRNVGTRDAGGDWTDVRFIHRDDLTPPDPDGSLIQTVRFEVHTREVFDDAAAKDLIAAVREHDAKAGEQS